jgi:AbiU2
MPEEKFKSYFNTIKINLDIAADAFYSHEAFLDISSSNKDIAAKLNENDKFWWVIIDSLQGSFIIALARIFDDGQDTVSIHKLVNYCVENPSLFCRDSLEKRKLKGRERPEGLDEYLDKVYYPSSEDLKVFYRELSPIRKLYDGCKYDKDAPNYILRKIRTKIFAHNISVQLDKIHDLYTKADFTNIHYLIVNLYDFLEVIGQLFKEGKKPKFGLTQVDFKTPTQETVERVLSSL